MKTTTISMRNVEKFLKDHPEISCDIQGMILAKAKELADRHGIIWMGHLSDLMREYSRTFLDEILDNQEHVKIGFEDLNRSVKGQSNSENRQNQ